MAMAFPNNRRVRSRYWKKDRNPLDYDQLILDQPKYYTIEFDHEVICIADNNANVRDLGNRVEMFPFSIVASMFGFEKWDFFEIDNLSERIAPKVENPL